VKAKSGITSINQLNGKTVATTTGTTSVQTLRKHERANGVDFKEVFGKDNVETGDVMISWGDPITDTTGSYFNHIANTIYVKSTGKTYVVDYWESGATGKPVIMTPEEWVAKWRDTISIGNDGVVYGDGNGRLEADLKAKGISLGDRADKRPPRSSSSTSAPASPSPIGPIIPLHR